MRRGYLAAAVKASAHLIEETVRASFELAQAERKLADIFPHSMFNQNCRCMVDFQIPNYKTQGRHYNMLIMDDPWKEKKMNRFEKKVYRVMKPLVSSLVQEAIHSHMRGLHREGTEDVCETCKCVIAQGHAIVGKGEIRKRSAFYLHPNEYIYYPKYCHRCAPKPRKLKGKAKRKK